MAGKSHLSFNVDAEALAAQFKEFALEVEQDLQKGIALLASTAHANILLEVAQESSEIQMAYKEKLSEPEEIEPGVWVITLDPKAFWIEEGIPEGADMKKWLLNGDSKMGKNGRYRIIPFKHDRGPSRQADMEGLLADAIKKKLNVEFKKINKSNAVDARKNGKEAPAKITATKIELDDSGSPRTGRLHAFNFGGHVPGKGNTPAMDGVSVYQTKKPDGGIRRDIFTFRTVTENQAGKWLHPGFKRRQFMDKAMHQTVTMWETEILPTIFRKWE